MIPLRLKITGFFLTWGEATGQETWDKQTFLGVSQTCLGANVLSGLVPSTVFKKNLWAFLGPCVRRRGRPWYGTSAQPESHFTCSSPRGAPLGGTEYVSFELFLGVLSGPGEGRGGAPGTVPLQNSEVTSRKACLRNAAFLGALFMFSFADVPGPPGQGTVSTALPSPLNPLLFPPPPWLFLQCSGRGRRGLAQGEGFLGHRGGGGEVPPSGTWGQTHI